MSSSRILKRYRLLSVKMPFWRTKRELVVIRKDFEEENAIFLQKSGGLTSPE